jgi:phage terminase large subunit-like protein
VSERDDWRTWLYYGGRGTGKTRSAAEWVREQIEGGKRRVALVGATASDARDVMVEGESGLLAIHPPRYRPIYEPSKRRVVWPHGAIATLYSADEPERLRGPQHDAAWADELRAWRYPEAWHMLQFGLRLGVSPRAIVTTTPRGMDVLREIREDPATVITRGSTYDNLANLAPSFIQYVFGKYEGTRLGEQELYARDFDQAEGALWQRDVLEKLRVAKPPRLRRVVVAIDPAVSAHAGSDETGIVVAALGEDGHGYVLEDLSGQHTPAEWAKRSVNAYRRHQAERAYGEQNNGGNLVEANLRTEDPHIAYQPVHASRGKRTRAEPVAALYEQGKVHHVGLFGQLEDEMCMWEALKEQRSPSRLDALVWAISGLMLSGSIPSFSSSGSLGGRRGSDREAGIED